MLWCDWAFGCAFCSWFHGDSSKFIDYHMIMILIYKFALFFKIRISVDNKNDSHLHCNHSFHIWIAQNKLSSLKTSWSSVSAIIFLTAKSQSTQWRVWVLTTFSLKQVCPHSAVNVKAVRVMWWLNAARKARLPICAKRGLRLLVLLTCHLPQYRSHRTK